MLVTYLADIDASPASQKGLFIAFSKYLGNIDGQVFVFFVMTVAAAEAAVGLALMIAFYKNRESIDVEDVNLMKL